MEKWAAVLVGGLVVFAIVFAAFMSWYVIPMIIIAVAGHFGADVSYWFALLGSLALTFLAGQFRR